MTDYIFLERTFSLLPNFISENSTQSSGSINNEYWSWEKLLENDRVILLAEAGSGKTTEIKEQVKTIRAKGKQAFFMTLEDLKDSFADAFYSTLGSSEEYASWKESGEPAYFFLDSVDEAKLQNERDFLKAIKRFSKELGLSNLGRAKIVITSRIVAWKSYKDLNDVNEILRGGSQSQYITVKSEYGAKFETPFRVVTMDALSEELIERFALAHEVEEPKIFIKNLKQQDSYSFATRPLDLEDLVHYWKKHKKISSRCELIKSSLDKKLALVDTHRDRCELNYDDAMYGASILASATFYCKQSDINNIESKQLSEGLNPVPLLKNWEHTKIETLLNRPLFNPSKYGSVRFFNIAAREYLTAKFIYGYRSKGTLSFEDVRDFFYCNIYGMIVARTSVKSVLAWYVSFDEGIFNYTLEYAPDVFLQDGDPSQIPVSNRAKVVDYYCKYLLNQPYTEIAPESNAVHRFATPELACTVDGLLTQYRSSDIVCKFLIRLAIACESKDVVELVKEMVFQGNHSASTKSAGLDYLVHTLDKSTFTEFLTKLLKASKDKNLIETVLYHWGNLVDIETLIYVTHPIFSGDANRNDLILLKLSVQKYFENIENEQLVNVIQFLTPIFTSKPYSNEYSSLISEKYVWLAKCVLISINRLIETKDESCLTGSVIDLLYRLQSHFEDHYDSKDEIKLIRKSIKKWSAINERLFWYTINSKRKEYRDEGKPKEVKCWWHAHMGDNLWSFSIEDFDLILRWIDHKEGDNKLVAVSLAYSLNKNLDNESAIDHLKLLKKQVGNEVAIVDFLDGLINPTKSEWEVQDEERQKKWKEEERKRQEQQSLNIEDWKTYIANNLDVLRDISNAEEGNLNGSQVHLLSCLIRENNNTQSSTLHNWKAIIETQFENSVLDAFCLAITSYWRNYGGVILRDEQGIPNSRNGGFLFALTGLQVESQTVPNWAENLTIEEAEIATKFSFSELNGFTDWVQDIEQSHPKVFYKVLREEIEWEFSNKLQNRDVHVLYKVSYHADWLHSKASEIILSILESFDCEKVDVIHKALKICLPNCMDSKSRLVSLAIKRLGETNCDITLVSTWLSLLLFIEPERGLIEFEQHLSNEEAALNIAMHTLKYLSEVSYIPAIHSEDGWSYSNYTNEQYCKLIELSYQIIRIEDDLDRANTGCYSPTVRDRAQDVRNRLLSDVTKLSGESVIEALGNLKKDYDNNTNVTDYFERLKKKIVLKDAEREPWTSEQFVDFIMCLEQKDEMMKCTTHVDNSTHIDKSTHVDFGKGNTFGDGSGNVNNSVSITNSEPVTNEVEKLNVLQKCRLLLSAFKGLL